jgi:hypothetical protein
MWFPAGDARPGARSRFVMAMAAATFLGLTATACGEPAADRVPGPDMTVRFDFDPAAVIVVSANGTDIEDVELEPGQVIEIINEAGLGIRFAGDGFDTGEMRDDESTVIAFTDAGDVELVQTVGGEATIRIAVAASQASG